MGFVFFLGVAIGLITAWNIWDQPKWLQTAIKNAVKKISG